MHKSGMRSLVTGLSSASLALAVSQVLAQEAPEKRQIELEEITVTGSQIRGAVISDALPVSILGSETLEAFGIDSGEQLLDMMPENGNNFVNEAANISGGVNSARGDVGAFNLRSLGTGNTLVLLNGRRMVNAPQYQTEQVGGSFVPVNSANSNMIPTYGVDRIEVLRDGASAVYGADAVAGVFNTVLKRDIEGLSVGLRYTDYDNFSRSNQTVYAEWGQAFNDGRTRVSVAASWFDRDRVNSQDDPRWANSDFSTRPPADSPWYGDSRLTNDSANSLWGQYDFVPSTSSYGINNRLTDTAGEFETYPIGDPRCQWALNATICGAVDGQGTVRENLNANRDLRSALKRANVYLTLDHELSDSLESFTELMYYSGKTNLIRQPSSFVNSASNLEVGAQNYWNPFGPCGSPNRLPDAIIGSVPCSGATLLIDNYRWSEVPRIVDNDSEMYRIVQGLRGSAGSWDWEAAATWNKATSDDITHNRISNTLMQEALNDPTSAAYNPFSGGVNSNIERALVDVYRLSETELTMFDARLSRGDLWSLPGGNTAMVVGLETRRESFKDDRDPRLDGTIQFTTRNGETYPFISDVMNSSPTPDSSGSRRTNSLYAELSLPVLPTLDIQLAARYEDFSDINDSATVGKVAFGWRPLDQLLLRGSWSQGFRVPNLVTVNESIVSRTNTRTDYVCQYAAEVAGVSATPCREGTLRLAQGSNQLVPEESDNYSVGLVFAPTDNLDLSVDYWWIKKTNSIGLLGEENHTLVDLLLRLEAGTSNCAAVQGDTAVVRSTSSYDIDPSAYLTAGLCPAGDIDYIDDRYTNLDERNAAGVDITINYEMQSQAGRFSLRYAGSFLTELEQTAGGLAGDLVAAQANGELPASYPVIGFADLVQQDGAPKDRHNVVLTWRKGKWGASVSAFRIGKVYDSGLTLADGTRYVLPAMTTGNLSVDYRFGLAGIDSRIRFGINNFTNERAPLADDYFGYKSDVHTDYGRNFYLDLRMSFGGR
ncbi:MAG: TonB-dependent receptor domain-containing protein [Steroidobacteraceae bacterium]